MKQNVIWILVFGLCSFNAESALRCGHKLVDLGDYKSKVLALCGEPESVETRTKIVGSTLHHPHRTLDIQQFEEIQIEEWIYNFGSSRFQKYLRFENGELRELKDLRRGH